VLGDNLGRGDSEGCVRLIQAVAEVSIVGNRDLDWQDRVDADTRAYVLGLPRLAQADGIAISHGDARLTRDLSTGEVTTGFRRARSWLTAHGCHAWIFGHSHRARVWIVPTNEEAPRLLFDAAIDPLPATIRLPSHDGNLCAINAGSIGLPFPGKGPASALLYDAETRLIELFPV
jgi:hypothetical protein